MSACNAIAWGANAGETVCLDFKESSTYISNEGYEDYFLCAVLILLFRRYAIKTIKRVAIETQLYTYTRTRTRTQNVFVDCVAMELWI